MDKILREKIEKVERWRVTQDAEKICYWYNNGNILVTTDKYSTGKIL